ncbi:MAG: aminoglycoside phosphotransferase family protein [Bacteroidia bacterium]|nr:aminoglycoside phosphotransferase family protein [Bacteroidia bacterium]
MGVTEIPASILGAYGLRAEDFKVEALTAGHIHRTLKLTGAACFVLQRVNKNVFKHPEVIGANVRAAADHLAEHFPDYSFMSTIRSTAGNDLVYDDAGHPWRLFPYIDHTLTVNAVSTARQAFRAAAAFGGLTRRLRGVDMRQFNPTIERFHDLSLRYRQFESALANADDNRRAQAIREIEQAERFRHLVARYEATITNLPLRVTHNDTKINNVLFHAHTGESVCVIDLDTLMPGYFIYDLGDMVRTFVSPVDEEEKDFERIAFRQEIYDALMEGYRSEMGDDLNAAEKQAVHFSGLMMTYIMGLRMLADFLNGDVYYHTTYPAQNLVRAGNQLRLLEVLADKIG